jgi:hypothetical protein
MYPRFWIAADLSNDFLRDWANAGVKVGKLYVAWGGRKPGKPRAFQNARNS